MYYVTDSAISLSSKCWWPCSCSFLLIGSSWILFPGLSAKSGLSSTPWPLRLLFQCYNQWNQNYILKCVDLLSYIQTTWRAIKFGGLVVHLCNCQIYKFQFWAQLHNIYSLHWFYAYLSLYRTHDCNRDRLNVISSYVVHVTAWAYPPVCIDWSHRSHDNHLREEARK